MDYYFWLLRSADTTVLVDCGFSPEGGAKRGRTTLVDPIEALAGLGVAPADIDVVVLTHAHYDHVGNLDRLPGVRTVMARAELDFWTSDVARRPQFWHSAEDDEISLLRTRLEDGTLELVDADTEVAPGVRIEIVGGHTPGQLVVHVETSDGQVLLTADAVHYYEELELDRPFAVVADVPAMYLAFERIRAASATVVAGHDPLVRERFPERIAWLPEQWRDDVVCVTRPEVST